MELVTFREDRFAEKNGTGRGRCGCGSFLQGHEQQESPLDRGAEQRDARKGAAEGAGAQDAQDVSEPAEAEEDRECHDLEAGSDLSGGLSGERRHRMGER